MFYSTTTSSLLFFHDFWMALGIVVVVLLLLSFALANFVAWCLQLSREHRIQRKIQELAAKSNHARNCSVPVTILTGSTGAGKTTLLNHMLLTDDHFPYKIMVLENEMGTISVDHKELLRKKENHVYVLQNGCMCCTGSRGKEKYKDELERILDYLLQLVQEQGFDYLMVETTGLSDPGPIIETFLRLRASRFRLDAVVTMVDAKATQIYWKEATQLYKFSIELQRQILYADLVVLNKMDMVTQEECTRLKRTLGGMNEEAVVYSCVNADVKLDNILNVKTFDTVRFLTQDIAANAGKGCMQVRYQRMEGTSTMHLEVERDVDVAAFGKWLSEVVTRRVKGDDMFRVKGALSVAGDAADRRCIVQGVLGTYTIAPGTAWENEAQRVSRLVMIGNRLDQDELGQGFQGLLLNVNSDGNELKKER